MQTSSSNQPIPPAISLHNVTKHFGKDGTAVIALSNVSINFAPGTFTAIMGPSGSGKSTLLQCAVGLERPTEGDITIGNVSLSGLNETDLTILRRQQAGFIFQSFNLLPSLTASQNVELPLRLAGQRPNQTVVHEALEQVGLGKRMQHRPSELSGGQQQRVAIARALVVQPAVLFADEPTGALDSTASRSLLELLTSLSHNQGQTIIMVTHDPLAASYASEVIFLADGEIADRLANPTVDAITRHMARLEEIRV